VITQFPTPTAVTIDYPHQKTHEGRYFSGGYYNASIANGATIELLIQMGAATTWHSKIRASSGGDATVQIFENATFSAAGTSVTVSNHNRSSSKVSDATVTHTPTLTADGTQVNGTILIPGGSTGNSAGGSGGFEDEYILAVSKVYLVRLTNTAGTSEPMSLLVEGYQPTL
jgi:hypothetical protein